MNKRKAQHPALLGGLTPGQFLKDYWQKRPLLVRGAFPGFVDPVSPEKLLALGCNPNVTSRLVLKRGGKKPWEVRHGPHRASSFRLLPASHWTLLVQGVDRLIPGVTELLNPFRFIPDWRVDDVMISFAAPGGTVGPHIDSYDVFLLQGQGRRRWQLDSRAPHHLRKNLDLRILKQFRAEYDWVLQPGDMLYLPPGLAHYGVALENCLTYSIGLRAPSAKDLLAAAQEHLLGEDAPNLLYSDPDLKASSFPAEISSAVIKRFRMLLKKSVQSMDDEAFMDLLGRLLTEPKGLDQAPDRSTSESVLSKRIQKGARLTRAPGSRLAFIKTGEGGMLFANGERFALDARLLAAMPLITQDKQLSKETCGATLKRRDFLLLLKHLIQAGIFLVER